MPDSSRGSDSSRSSVDSARYWAEFDRGVQEAHANQSGRMESGAEIASCSGKSERDVTNGPDAKSIFSSFFNVIGNLFKRNSSEPPVSAKDRFFIIEVDPGRGSSSNQPVDRISEAGRGGGRFAQAAVMEPQLKPVGDNQLADGVMEVEIASDGAEKLADKLEEFSSYRAAYDALNNRARRFPPPGENPVASNCLPDRFTAAGRHYTIKTIENNAEGTVEFKVERDWTKNGTDTSLLSRWSLRVWENIEGALHKMIFGSDARNYTGMLNNDRNYGSNAQDANNPHYHQ